MRTGDRGQKRDMGQRTDRERVGWELERDIENVNQKGRLYPPCHTGIKDRPAGYYKNVQYAITRQNIMIM